MVCDTLPKGGLKVDYTYPRREVIARKMYLERCTLDMGFCIRNNIVNPLTTGKLDIWWRWWRRGCSMVVWSGWSSSF